MGRDVVLRAVSFSDLAKAGIEISVHRDGESLSVNSVRDNGRKVTVKDLSDMLYTLGIFTNRGFEVLEKSVHRTFSGEVTENYRISGSERLDKDWLDSGYASEEARLASSGMRDMLSHCNKLQNGGD